MKYLLLLLLSILLSGCGNEIEFDQNNNFSTPAKIVIFNGGQYKRSKDLLINVTLNSSYVIINLEHKNTSSYSTVIIPREKLVTIEL